MKAKKLIASLLAMSMTAAAVGLAVQAADRRFLSPFVTGSVKQMLFWQKEICQKTFLYALGGLLHKK